MLYSGFPSPKKTRSPGSWAYCLLIWSHEDYPYAPEIQYCRLSFSTSPLPLQSVSFVNKQVQTCFQKHWRLCKCCQKWFGRPNLRKYIYSFFVSRAWRLAHTPPVGEACRWEPQRCPHQGCVLGCHRAGFVQLWCWPTMAAGTCSLKLSALNTKGLRQSKPPKGICHKAGADARAPCTESCLFQTHWRGNFLKEYF